MGLGRRRVVLMVLAPPQGGKLVLGEAERQLAVDRVTYADHVIACGGRRRRSSAKAVGHARASFTGGETPTYLSLWQPRPRDA